MSVTTTYNCNLCRMITERTDLFSWYFKTEKSYSLLDDTSKCDIHICKSCLTELKTQLAETRFQDL